MILVKLKAIFKLMRWFHEVAVMLPFVSLYLVINYFAEQNSSLCVLPLHQFVILCFCIQLLIAAGCVLNDIVDRKIDYINKPQTHIINNTITLTEAKLLFAVLTFLIIICSMYISVYVFWQWSYIALIVYLISLLYD